MQLNCCLQTQVKSSVHEMVAKFKQENPASYYILRTFIENRSLWTARLIGLSINSCTVSDNNFYVLTSELNDSEGSVLEIEKKLQAHLPLTQGIKSKKYRIIEKSD